MSYDVNFIIKHEHCEYVGDKWISHTSKTAEMMKEVCGSWPSTWDGMRCADMYPILMQGIALLKDNPERYRHLEAGNGWGTVETTINFLSQIAENCQKHPTAIIEVI